MSSNLAIAITVGATVGGAIAGLKNLRSVVGLLRNDSVSTGKKLSVLGTGTAVAAAGAVNSIKAVSGAVLNVADEAIKFESAMADVKKVVDFKSPEGLKNLQKDILEMTRTIPMTKEELAAIAASGGQLGVAEQDLKSFTNTIAKMSVAFDMPAEQAGDNMAKLANVYKIPIAQIGKLGDAINHLSNSSPAKANDIVNTLGRVGGVAKQFGLTELQTASLSNAFISLGKTPEVAGTAINGMLTKLGTADKQGAKFQKALAAIGTDSKSLKKAIKDNGEQALVDFLKQVEKLPKADQMGTLVDLFGLEYADDVAVLVGGLDTYKKSIEELQKTGKGGGSAFMGSMEKEFSARSATAENGLTLLKNGWSEFMTVIGDRLLPVINQVSTAMAKLMHWLTDLAAKNPALVDGLIAVAAVLAGVVVGVTTLTAILGASSIGFLLFTKQLLLIKTASAVLGRGILAVIRFLPALGAAFMRLGMALMTNPIFLALGLLAAAAYLLYKNWDAVVAGAKALWQSLANFFSGLWTRVTAFFSTAWANIKSIFRAALSAILGFIRNFSPVSAFRAAFAAVWGWLSGLGSRFASYGSQMISGLVNGIKAGIGRAVAAVQSVVSAVKSAFTSDSKGMGIHSPSRVFRAYGNYMTEGLAIGVNGGAKQPVSAVGAFAGRLKESFGSRIGQLRADVTARVSGNRAEFEQARAAASSGGGITIHFNPTINAAGGHPQQIQTAMQLGLREFEALFRRMLAEHERRKY